jgi:hypothetical protein
MRPRRAQTAVNIRSDKAASILARLAGPGRSQALVIEEALDHLERVDDAPHRALEEARAEFRPQPQFRDEKSEDTFWKILEIAQRASKLPRRFASMAEFDAHEYDDRGNPR